MDGGYDCDERYDCGDGYEDDGGYENDDCCYDYVEDTIELVSLHESLMDDLDSSG